MFFFPLKMKSLLRNNKALLCGVLASFLVLGALVYVYRERTSPVRSFVASNFMQRTVVTLAAQTSRKEFVSSLFYDNFSTETRGSPSTSMSPFNSEHEPAITTLTFPTTLPQKLPSFYPSKELFVRAVYFDGRPRNNHINSSVFLIVVKKSITDNKLITGCQIDNHRARDFEVRLIGETPLWRHFYPKINHEEAFVECYDMPARNGSMGYIFFKRDENAEVELAASERPVFMSGPRAEPSTAEGKNYGFTIAACAKVFGNNPPWLKEWLTYQKTLGVQHVHLDAEDTFVRAGWLKKPFIQKAMQEGFLSIDVWKKYLSPSEIWYHNQGLIYEDCVYRLRGVYDYLILVDTDDFFTPRNPTQKQLYFYIQKYCRGEGIGSCKFKWIEYYPDQLGLDKSIPIPDGNVTCQLKNYSHYIQGNPKSLHKTNVIVDAATHYAYTMLSGYRIVSVSPNELYVAHVRMGNRMASGKSLHIGPPTANGCLQHTVNRLLLVCMFLLFLLCFS